MNHSVAPGPFPSSWGSKGAWPALWLLEGSAAQLYGSLPQCEQGCWPALQEFIVPFNALSGELAFTPARAHVHCRLMIDVAKICIGHFQILAFQESSNSLPLSHLEQHYACFLMISKIGGSICSLYDLETSEWDLIRSYFS